MRTKLLDAGGGVLHIAAVLLAVWAPYVAFVLTIWGLHLAM